MNSLNLCLYSAHEQKPSHRFGPAGRRSCASTNGGQDKECGDSEWPPESIVGRGVPGRSDHRNDVEGHQPQSCERVSSGGDNQIVIPTDYDDCQGDDHCPDLLTAK